MGKKMEATGNIGVTMENTMETTLMGFRGSRFS